MTQNPWRGLSAYKEPSEEDKYIYKFCGRDNESDELTTLIRNNLHVTLYGKTGIGKTSLLEAGVFPKLRKSNYMPIIVRFSMMEKNKKPFAQLLIDTIESQFTKNAIIERTTIEKSISEKETKIPNNENDNENTTSKADDIDCLWAYFATRHFYILKKNGENEIQKKIEVFPVIVFDQFEENLISNEKQTLRLLEQLHSLIDDNKEFPENYHNETNFRIVISIREDDLFRLEDCIDRSRLQNFKTNRYRLKQLTEEKAAEVIIGPGEEYLPKNEEEKEAVIKKILSLAIDKENSGISTLILSLVCSILYQQVAKKGGEYITLQDVERTAKNPLEDFYKEIPISDKKKKQLEDELVDDNGRRNTINYEKLTFLSPEEKATLTKGPYRTLQVSVNEKVELVHDMLAKHLYEVKQRRQKRRTDRILKISLFILITILFFTGMLGSVYTYVENDKRGRIEIFPKNEINLKNDSATNSCSIQIDRIKCDIVNFNGGDTLDISNQSNLKRIKIHRKTNYITIENCPQLRYIEFKDDIRVDNLKLTHCPNLKWIYLPDTINNIESDNDLTLIPSSNQYTFKNGILWKWDNNEGRIIYIDNSKLRNGEKVISTSFPQQMYNSMGVKGDSIKYDYYDRKVVNYIWNEQIINKCIFYGIDRKYVLGYIEGGPQEINLSGIRVSDKAFENCKNLECIEIDNETKFGSQTFDGCTNLKEIRIHQDSSFKIQKIYDLLECLRPLYQHITYEIIGTGPLAKTKNGLITYNEIPVLISNESSESFAITTKNDTTYLCTRGWLVIVPPGEPMNSHGQPNGKDFQYIFYEHISGLHANKKGINLYNLLFVEDSFIKGSIFENRIYCRNLTSKQRKWFIADPNTVFFNLQDSIKKEISISVPYGKLNYFLYRKSFDGFADIKEASLIQTIYYNIYYTMAGAISYLSYYRFIRAIFILCIAVAFCILWYKLSKRKKSIFKGFKKAISITFIAIGTWFSIYWLFWYWIPWNDNIRPVILCNILGVIGALIVIILTRVRHKKFMR